MLSDMQGMHLAAWFLHDCPHKDIIYSDTLLHTVSSTHIWHPSDKKVIYSSAWSQDKICLSILKQSGNREAYWPRECSS